MPGLGEGSGTRKDAVLVNKVSEMSSVSIKDIHERSPRSWLSL